jgi:hypothetical protein
MAPDEIMKVNRQRAPKESSPTLRGTFRGVNLALPIDRVVLSPLRARVFGNSNTQGFSAPAIKKSTRALRHYPLCQLTKGLGSDLVCVRFRSSLARLLRFASRRGAER